MSRAHLHFAHRQGLTRVVRQFASYPFHLTRPFYLDAARPDLATLYLQSSSGGIYRGESLQLDLTFAPQATAEVTTQAATLVRAARGGAAVMRTRLALGAESIAFYTPELSILFPGAEFRSSLQIELAADARAVCIEGACLAPGWSPKDGTGTYHSEFMVHADDGRLLMAERGRIDLRMLGTPASPLGPFFALGAAYLLNGHADFVPIIRGIEATGCIAGASALPNDAGMAVRLLAEDGGTLARGLSVAVASCFEAASGIKRAPRRK